MAKRRIDKGQRPSSLAVEQGWGRSKLGSRVRLNHFTLSHASTRANEPSSGRVSAGNTTRVRLLTRAGYKACHVCVYERLQKVESKTFLATNEVMMERERERVLIWVGPKKRAEGSLLLSCSVSCFEVLHWKRVVGVDEISNRPRTGSRVDVWR